MSYVKNFGLFWYDFIVGDDWTIAVGVVAVMIASFVLERIGVPAWWFFFLAICGLLFFTVRRAAHD